MPNGPGLLGLVVRWTVASGADRIRRRCRMRRWARPSHPSTPC